MRVFRKGLYSFLILGIYFLVAAVALGTNPFHHKTVTPFDVLVSQRAWNFVDPGVHVRDYQRSDILNSRLPQWEVAKKQLWQGHLPRWNDKIAGGGTFFTVNTDIFTPAFLVFAAMPDSAKGFFWAMLVDLIIAGVGMHVFLRKHVSTPAAIAGAVSFELCGFIAAWLYWPHVFVIIWAPWLLAAIDRCATRPTRSNTLAVAATSALACLGGFPFLSVLVMEAGALLALIHFIFLYRSGSAPGKFATHYIVGTILGLVLAALPLIGLAHWLGQFDLGYRDNRGSYLDFHDIKQLVPPWAYQTQRVEQTMYVGLVMTAAAAATLFALPFAKRKVQAFPVFAVTLLIISFGLVFGLWPMWLIGWLPGMSFNSWSRAIGLLEIAMIAIGCIGIDYLWKKRNHQACLTWIKRGAVVAIIFIQIIEMTNFDRAYNGAVKDRYYYPKVPTISYMTDRVGHFDYVITDKSFLMSGTLGVYGLREWLAHYFRTPELQDVLRHMAKHPFNTHVASASRFPAKNIHYDASVMASFNVRYAAISDKAQPETKYFKRVFESEGTAVYENTRSPDGPYMIHAMKDVPNARSARYVKVSNYHPDHFEIAFNGKKPGLLVTPMSYNDEWHVTINNKPAKVRLKDGVMPVVSVQPGDTVTFTYHPYAGRFCWAWLASLIALFGLVWALPGIFRRLARDPMDLA